MDYSDYVARQHNLALTELRKIAPAATLVEAAAKATAKVDALADKLTVAQIDLELTQKKLEAILKEIRYVRIEWHAVQERRQDPHCGGEDPDLPHALQMLFDAAKKAE